jgi:hypothetical protein
VFLTVVALLAVIIHANAAEQRTIYGRDGQPLGRTSVDSSGSATLYDPFTGKAVTRTDKNGTVYDAQTGNVIVKQPEKGR